MNLVQTLVLEKIELGEWIVPILQPFFFKELSNKKPMPSGLHIPSMVYENVSLQITDNLTVLKREFFQSESDFNSFCNLIKTIGDGGEFTSFEEVTLQKSLNKFIDEYSNEFILLKSVFSGFFRVRNGNFSGSSNPRAWGVYFLGDRFFDLADEQKTLSLIHEMAHHELFLIQLLDRLARPEADSSLVYAPLQKRERPPIKRLHSLWALFRMLQFAIKYQIDHGDLKNKFEQNAVAFLADELTEYGSILRESVIKCFERQCA